VIQAPSIIKPHRQRGQQRANASRQVQIAGRRILHLVQFGWEAAEVVNRSWRRAYSHRGVRNVPVADTQRIAFGRGRLAPINFHCSV